MTAGNIDIILDRMPPILLAIVGEAIAACACVSVIASDVPSSDMPAAVAAKRPDVVILSNPDAIGIEEDIAHPLGPPVANGRVITLFGTDRGARLHLWQHSVTLVHELSTEALCDAILGARHG